jgi:hypothetical protein
MYADDVSCSGHSFSVVKGVTDTIIFVNPSAKQNRLWIGLLSMTRSLTNGPLPGHSPEFQFPVRDPYFHSDTQLTSLLAYIVLSPARVRFVRMRGRIVVGSIGKGGSGIVSYCI